MPALREACADGPSPPLYPPPSPLKGVVTCLDEEDMPALREALDTPLQPVLRWGLFPSFEQFELFASQVGGRALPPSALS